VVFVTPEWATVVVTLLLGLIGVYLGHNYRRQVRLDLASHRLEAYSSLWEETGLAAPTRLDEGTGLAEVGRPLSRSLSVDERMRLYRHLTTWYYKNGGGMLLAADTRSLYLNAKHNLVCADESLAPKAFRKHLVSEALLSHDRRLTAAERGCYSIRQLSLLRSQMKADLAIYGVPFVGTLQRHEQEFLRGCGVNLLRRPWRRAMPSRSRALRWLLSRRWSGSEAATDEDTAEDVKLCHEPRATEDSGVGQRSA
jgi:hypothetical protein